MSFFMFIENPHWGNVDAVIDGIVENQENATRERLCLKAHALSVTLPGFNFFRSKFDPEHGQLAPQMKLLKLARLCNPVRLREVTPSPEQLDELTQFKLVSSEESPNLLQRLKDELPGFRALANDINANLFHMESILPFFLSHSAEFSTWGQFASLLASQQINSASVERVFSMLKRAFKETQ